MRIAPDVEKLMWVVAESADSQAIADFESRFPELRYELSQRIDMVRQLKASRQLGRNEGFIPRFHHARPSLPNRNRRWQVAVAALAFSALAFGSFYVTKNWVRPAMDPAPTSPRIILEPPPNTAPPSAVQPTEPTRQPTHESPPVASNSGDEPPVMEAWDKPQTVKFERINLHDALKAIAANSGLSLEIGPGTPNPEIQVDFQNMSGMEILLEMGPEFGFTPFSQGEGKVIVIPARDESGGNGGGGIPGNEKPHTPFNRGEE